jgi:diguanylate cyclase (GGDEF)-like protein
LFLLAFLFGSAVRIPHELQRLFFPAKLRVHCRALCRLAQIIKDCSRSIDTAARHGGDEFALVLPETGADAARLVGQRIRELLAKESEEPILSVSVGVAGYPSDATTIGTLLYAADRALYQMNEATTGTP